MAPIRTVGEGQNPWEHKIKGGHLPKKEQKDIYKLKLPEQDPETIKRDWERVRVVCISLPNSRSRCGAPYTWDIGISGCSAKISAYCGLSNLYSSWVPSMTLKYSRIPATTSFTANSLYEGEKTRRDGEHRTVKYLLLIITVNTNCLKGL